MCPTPLSQWLAMSKSSLAMYKQLTEATDANVHEAAAQLPAGQAQIAQLIKSMLDMGRQWKELQADAFTSLLHAQLTAFNSQLPFTSMQNILELQQALAVDLSAQRYTALKQVSERVNACLDDLRKAGSQDDVAIVISCMFDDVGKQLRANAEQTFTSLNSAATASTVLTHKALDEMIGEPPP